MSDDNAGPGTSGEGRAAGVVGSRWPELLLAMVLMAIAIVVMVDARRVGIGWDEFDGPGAGYFPFRVGCLLLTASGWIALKQLLNWRRSNPVFADTTQLGMVWAITWPMGVYVALVQPLGIYVASAMLIAFFMRRHGKYRLPAMSAVALGVPLFFFVVFERWFLVSLPKGPLEAWFGY